MICDVVPNVKLPKHIALEENKFELRNMAVHWCQSNRSITLRFLPAKSAISCCGRESRVHMFKK